MVGSIDVTVSGSSPRPALPGKPVVLVPYFSTIEKECEESLRGLSVAGVAIKRSSLSAIDLLRSTLLSHALRDGFDRFLFVDADIGFDPPRRDPPAGEARAGRRRYLCP